MALNLQRRAIGPAAMLVWLGIALAASGLSHAGATSAAARTRLIMVESPDCIWCQRWHAQIGPAYPKSVQGIRAPLERHRKRDFALQEFAPVTFTPTFILVRDGREIDRLVGYPGARYFWGEIDAMLDKLADFENGPEQRPMEPGPADPTLRPGTQLPRDAMQSGGPRRAPGKLTLTAFAHT